MTKLTKYLIASLFLVLIACVEQKKVDAMKSDTSEHMFLVYDEMFAKHFGLSLSKSSKLSDGLHALGIHIVNNQGRYQCSVNLYLDRSLDIYSPNNGKDYIAKTDAELVIMRELSNDEVMRNSERESKAQLKILFRSKQLLDKKDGLIESPVIELFKETIFTDISLLSYNTACSMLRNEYGQSEIYVQKKSAPTTYNVGDEQPSALINTNNSYRFEFPISLLNEIQSAIELAVNNNVSKTVVVESLPELLLVK